ncbi:hypothetical protein MED297_06114 [Reinekea sp. MED297]|uniref:Uncharacterized protein n=1 Tax=Reinekea blandensis MED297 TaxID=314283 RepID=A4BDF7_9GAMM|nr:hypothetical protein MED297_06114 [Reinekea sp. MED297] [Reinekea blandensis MED297]
MLNTVFVAMYWESVRIEYQKHIGGGVEHGGH